MYYNILEVTLSYPDQRNACQPYQPGTAMLVGRKVVYMWIK